MPSFADLILVLAAFTCGHAIHERNWIGVVIGLATVVAVEVEKALS